MQIDFVHSGFFKLDGGAMFGIVPKVMWEKKNAPDENNLCQWAARCLLIRDKGRVILVDTGLGNKQDEKFRSHFHPHGEQSLLTSLAQHGVEPEDVTDVLLTHLHLIPSSAHVRAPWIIAYDIRPLLTLEEKARFVEEAAVDGYTVGFEHDPIVGSARLVKNKKGRITIEAISI